MVDADAITTLRYITEVCQGVDRAPSVIIELVHTSNMKFVSWNSKGEKKALNKMLGETAEDASPLNESVLAGDDSLNYLFQPIFAAGRVYMSKLVDSALADCYNKQHGLSLLKSLVSGTGSLIGKRHFDVNAPRRRLFQIPCPPAVAGRSVSDALYTLMFQNDLLLIGLFRDGRSCRSPLPFVHTNPDGHNTHVDARDLLFVIGTPPTDEAARESWAKRRQERRTASASRTSESKKRAREESG